MTPLALAAKLSEMLVFARMTGRAVARELHFTCGSAMTVRARAAGVRARKREARLLAVVEVPDRPPVGRVTRPAGAAEPALVDIGALVAPDTIPRHALELRLAVALHAWHSDVQPDQRKVREIVVKDQCSPPGLNPMALLAVAPKFPGVYVTRAMAGHAIIGQLRVPKGRGMAGMAIDASVRACECESRLLEMIEPRRLPCVLGMATIAPALEAPLVRVIAGVAAVTILGQIVFHAPAAMTARALEVTMATKQREARFLGMIEFRVVPGHSRMAVRTPCPAGPAVHIVGCVTRSAPHGRRSIAMPGMTGSAAHLPVCPGQREMCPSMVKAKIAPACARMAAAAVLTETARMRVILAMTGGAASRSLAVRLATCVARGAGDGLVPTVEGEIRCSVVETVGCELHNVRVATLVLRVAGGTFDLPGPRHAAVQTAAPEDVGVHFFVTPATEARLAGAVRTIMAPGALRLDIGMPADDLARHQQRLDACGAHSTRQQDSDGNRDAEP